MRQISLVGAVDEEVGDYFPEFLDMLEESPFLRVSSNLWCFSLKTYRYLNNYEVSYILK